MRPNLASLLTQQLISAKAVFEIEKKTGAERVEVLFAQSTATSMAQTFAPARKHVKLMICFVQN